MAGQQPDARTALATRANQGNEVVPIEDRISRLEPSFQLAMPRGLEARRLVRDAITCLRTIKDLDKCDGDSIVGALMTCAQLGLRPGVLGHAWPLPYWDGRSQGFRAQLVIGYQGLVELAHRSGSVASLVARVVYANDHFDIDYGLSDTLVHKPELHGPRGTAVGYYAIVKFLGGGYTFWHMTLTEMQEHRDKYAPRNRQGQIVGPWVAHFDAQGLKTCVRMLAKFMPKTADLAEAVAADGGLRVNADPTMPPSDVTGPAAFWDGQVIDDAAVSGPDVEPAPAAAKPKPERTEHDRLLQQLHIWRNKLDGFAGTSDDARETFLVHVASVIGHEVTSTKDLTVEELQTVVDDLKRAKREQDTHQRGGGTRPISEVAAEQAAALRTVTRPEEEEPPY